MIRNVSWHTTKEFVCVVLEKKTRGAKLANGFPILSMLDETSPVTVAHPVFHNAGKAARDGVGTTIVRSFVSAAAFSVEKDLSSQGKHRHEYIHIRKKGKKEREIIVLVRPCYFAGESRRFCKECRIKKNGCFSLLVPRRVWPPRT
jgi:hypothetical protein